MTYPTPKELGALLPDFVRNPNPQIYLGNNYVVVDFETTTQDFGTPHCKDNTIILASWINGPGHICPGLNRHIGSALEQEDLADDIRLADFFIAHNTKFELGWIERCGLKLETLLPYCTMIAEKVTAGNRQWRLDLNSCLARHDLPCKDEIGKLIRAGVDTRNIPIAWLGRYCDQDVLATEALFLDQRAQLEQDGLLPVTYTRNLLTPCLYDIEKPGLHLDTDRVNAVHAYYVNREARLTLEWNTLSGGVNPKSGPQKSAYLIHVLGIKPSLDAMGKPMLTPGKLPQMGAPALNAMKPRTAKAKKALALLLDLVATRDALSKYVTQLKNCVDEDGGILYGEFLQTVAQTHRLSGRGRIRTIQPQNFQKKFRPVVTARTKGWSIGDGDAANIEFRAAIDLAQDDQGISDIKEGVDIHANTARVLSPDLWDEHTGSKVGTNQKLRDAAKANTFKPLYGGQTGTSNERAYFKFFRERYASVEAMQKGWTETVLRDKKLRIASGLTFYWPDCTLSRDGKYIRHTTNIYNYPVQNLATAEMCPTSTLYLWHMMKTAKMQSFLIDIVHDSAVGEIHPGEREQWACYLKYCFNELIVWYLKRLYEYTWVVPLESAVVFNKYWNESDGWEAQWK